MEARQPTTTSPARSPRTHSNTLWRSRTTLYKFSVLLLIVVWPFNLLSVVLPYWLEAQGSVGDVMVDSSSKVQVSYGLWTLCTEGSGCNHVHSVISDVGVGVWLYAAAFFTLVSVVFHAVASVCGALQNFMPRRISRECTCFLKSVLHRDCAYAEDVGFVAGFMGMTSNIIVMMCTKDVVSDGATYSYSFALSFFSASIALVSSIALTKAHYIAYPAPRRGQSNVARAHQPQPVTGTTTRADPVEVFHGGATASASRNGRDTASAGRGMGDSAAMELGELASLGEQADTESASLRVQLGSRDHYDPERYSPGQREDNKVQREGYGSPKQDYKDQNGLRHRDREPRSSRSHEHENQAYVKEKGDSTHREPRSSGNQRNQDSDDEHYGRPQSHGESGRPQSHGESGRPQSHGESGRPQSHGESGRPQSHGESGRPQSHGESGRPQSHGESGRPQSHGESARPKERGATTYWRGKEEDSARPQDLDAKVLEESDQVREEERRTRWHGRTGSRSRSRSRSKERRHSRRRHGSGDSSSSKQPLPGKNTQQHHQSSFGNSRSSGLVRSVEMEDIHAAVSTGDMHSAPPKKPAMVSNTQHSHSSGNSRKGLVRSVEMENIPAAVSSSSDPPPRSSVPPPLRQQTPLTEHLRSSPVNHTNLPPSTSKSPRTDASSKLRQSVGDVRPPVNDVRLRTQRDSKSIATEGGEASAATRL